MADQGHGRPLGINGLGRIGKLCVWHHAARGYFPSLVVNVGRPVGRDLEAVCGVIQNDSTYGNMDRFLFGVSATPSVRIVDRDRNLLEVAGGASSADCVTALLCRSVRAPGDAPGDRRPQRRQPSRHWPRRRQSWRHCLRPPARSARV